MGGGSSVRRGGARAPLRYRGTTLGATAIAQIRRIVRECTGLTRTQISRRVCRYFGWRCTSGAFAVQSAMGLLARLEREGVIGLPPLRRRPDLRRSARRVVSDAPMPSFVHPERTSVALLVRPLRLDEREAYRAHLDRHHYLGWRQPPGNFLGHVAFLDGEVVALLGWATATLHNRARDEWIGWDAAARSRNLRCVATNVRFLMLPASGVAERGKNLASRVLSSSLHRLSADWQEIHGHPLLLAETFVDGSRFLGTCYRASNWILVGQTSGWSRSGKNYSFHGLPKDVFVFPLHRRARARLCAADHPVNALERGERSMMLDVSRLPLEGQDGLFDLLSTIKDPRDPRGVRHKAPGTLAMAVTGVLAGARGYSAIAQWIDDLPGEVRERLGGSRYRRPSLSSIRRLLIAIDVAELNRLVGEWTLRHRDLDLRGEGIAIDGKTLRGSRDGGSPPVHLVSAVLHADGEVVAQTQVPDKSNEITSVEPVLSGLNIEGATVTGDAMFTQTEIAKHIVEEKNADYLCTVKDNQPTLRKNIENMGLESFSPALHDDVSGTRAHRDS